MGELNTRLLFFHHEDNWQDIKNATMNTIGKEKGKYPDSEWKRKLIMAEHSPIRKLKFAWRWMDLPYWVSVHFVRHKIGIEHFVKTQRTDRDRPHQTRKRVPTHLKIFQFQNQAFILIGLKFRYRA